MMKLLATWRGDMEAIIILLILLGIYFLPWIIAFSKTSCATVFVINLFLGWTFLGWVVALAMAVAPERRAA